MKVVGNAWAPVGLETARVSFPQNSRTLEKTPKYWSKKTLRITTWIDRCNLVLNLLGGLEEQRPLSLREFNFEIVKRRIPIFYIINAYTGKIGAP
jgi:hypothetical protein